jgi:hypothetical protein
LRLIARNNRAKLPDGPFRGGVLRHIPVHDPAGVDFKNDKDVQRTKRRRDGREEIAREDGAGMIAYERAPRMNRTPSLSEV